MRVCERETETGIETETERQSDEFLAFPLADF